MNESNAVALTALSLNTVMFRMLLEKGLFSQAEIKEEIDASMLLMEEQGLASGGEGKAVHQNLMEILAIVSAPRLPKGPRGT